MEMCIRDSSSIALDSAFSGFKKEVGVTPKKSQEMLRNGSDGELSGKEHQE